MLEKRFYDFRDVMEIYGVGESIARKMIKEIRNIYEDGHPLPRGKVYATDLELYENLMKKRKVKKWLVSES